MKRCSPSCDQPELHSYSTPQKKKKKKKRCDDITNNDDSSTSPTTITPGGPIGRAYTVSVALPGSIIHNAQTAELRTYLAGQIARALVVFNVDEVVVFDEDSGSCGQSKSLNNPNAFLGRILHYLETPQYLRKSLFPMHSDLRYVGILNPLDCPHHMRQSDDSPYREGVVLENPGFPTSSLINCGLQQNVRVDKKLRGGVRVTVAIQRNKKSKGVRGRVVSPSVPRTEGGVYWGYTIRMASTFAAVFTESPFEDGYDITIGTSERGDNIDHLDSIPPFKHALVVLGGVHGLEHSLKCDKSLDVEDVSLLFHHYLNVCPNQGSRTIRTEEALLVVLSSLRPLLISANQ